MATGGSAAPPLGSRAVTRSPTLVRLVVPTSTSVAPDWASTSGTRNPPPISTSSPRLTMTPRSLASVANANMTAAAQLLTTSAASAPVSMVARSVTAAARGPRPPSARLNSRLVYRSLPDADTGDRPRLVCSNTPVPLITSRASRATRLATAESRTPSTWSAGTSATTRRASPTRVGWGNPEPAWARARRSIEGGCTRGRLVVDSVGEAWDVSAASSVVARACRNDCREPGVGARAGCGHRRAAAGQ